ncbi:uncharacterized protein KIAA1143 homolog isoform X1 [Mobula hypostoma]|uniref:uncharacterized protein KIAA1143 homolog isoform X1 n=1 Tax=Mobula hypostoma TaxID=723540 RepID=UPI002FC359FF
MNRKNNVSFVKPEPAFIRRFKEGVGYSPGPTVKTKKQQLAPVDSDSGPSDAEDEQPQVVVLRQGDLTAEEAAKFKQDTESSEKYAPVGLKELKICGTANWNKSRLGWGVLKIYSQMVERLCLGSHQSDPRIIKSQECSPHQAKRRKKMLVTKQNLKVREINPSKSRTAVCFHLGLMMMNRVGSTRFEC